MAMPCDKRWQMLGWQCSGSVARRRMITQRFLTECRRSTTARTRRWGRGWRPWVRAVRGLYQGEDAWEQELRDLVEWMVAQRPTVTIGKGRVGALVARPWPGATPVSE